MISSHNIDTEASGPDIPIQTKPTHSFEWFFLSLEILIVVLYGVFADFNSLSEFEDLEDNQVKSAEYMQTYYSSYQDINVMIFVGFGFLMTYLRLHSWTSVSLNFMVGAVCIQLYVLYAALWQGIIHSDWKLELSLDILIKANFSAASASIVFGGVLGKVNPLQLLVLVVIETFFYALNEIVTIDVLNTIDVGGSITIHTFGGYFGIACAMASKPRNVDAHPLNNSNYTSNLFAMIGTLFLWLYWPSFNSALAVSPNTAHRIVISTVLSLTGSCIAAFIISAFMNSGKFNMESILNATLAGGVVIGASANLMKRPYPALIAGFIAGTFSTLGFTFISPKLNKWITLHDTAGIHNLHAIPGVLAGLLSAIMVTFLNSSEIEVVSGEGGRDSSEQAAYQIAGTFFTLGLATTSGFITGWIIRFKAFKQSISLFDDKDYWVMNPRAISSISPKGLRLNPNEDDPIRLNSKPNLMRVNSEEKEYLDDNGPEDANCS